MIELVVIGGSAGSLDVLLHVVAALPADFPAPIAIALHLLPGPSLMARVLGDRAALPVREPDDKEPVRAGTIYVAPPGYHLLVERDRTFALSVDPPVHFSRPSIDVLFASAAEARGAAVAGLVLSGASPDGADGLHHIAAAGGLALVQDPASASAPTMPEAALARLPHARVLPVAAIAPLLIDVTSDAPRGAPGAAP